MAYPAGVADALLTALEMREAEQMEYGIFDMVHTGSDVLKMVSGDPLEVETALRRLVQNNLVIRLRRDAAHDPSQDSPDNWILRSRIAEVVRLVRDVRQRFEYHRNHSQSPQLVTDVKFVVRPRKVPRRNIPLSAFLSEATKAVPDSDQSMLQARQFLEIVLNADGKSHWAEFQQSACARIIEHLSSDKTPGPAGTVVCAGTGSGKTLAYFVPALLHVIRQRMFHNVRGCKTICIYPRILLARQQLEEFTSLVYSLNQLPGVPPEKRITLGIDYGHAPYRMSEIRTRSKNGPQQADSPWSEVRSETNELMGYGFVASCCPACQHRLYIPLEALEHKEHVLECENPDCKHSRGKGSPIDFIWLTKDKMAAEPPDILVTTTESLNDRLMSPQHQAIFGDSTFCAPSLILLDEIHLHTGLSGSQVANVVRRLLSRIKAQGTQNPVHVVGLSATITEPESFFADLTGLYLSRIRAEVPDDRDGNRDIAGAEYFMFVKPSSTGNVTQLSTLIQTVMATVHTFWRSESDEMRTFAFVNSLDLVGRWSRDMDDAESSELFRLRCPSHVMRSEQAQAFFFKPERCDGCPQGPRVDCSIFTNGECWWVAEHGGLSKPATVATVSSRGGQPNSDLVIASPSLEVGYDDPAVQVVVQYQSPMSLAGFVQRKGRGGRQIGTRPLMVTVLSPYRSIDTFNYRNHSRLANPCLPKPPLNAENALVQRIHAFYALMDWLAMKASQQPDGRERYWSPRLNLKMLEFIAKETVDEKEMSDFITYLSRCLGIPKHTAREWLFSGKELIGNGLAKLVREGTRKLGSENAQDTLNIRDTLPEYLPPNLFSDINLPCLTVEIAGQQDETMPINMGITETCPGNVTYRFGGAPDWRPYWAAPEPLLKNHGTLLIDLTDSYGLKKLVSMGRYYIPSRIVEKFGCLEDLDEIDVYRATSVRVSKLRDIDGTWCYDDASGQVARVRSGKTRQEISDRSAAYPMKCQAISMQHVQREVLAKAHLGDSLLVGDGRLLKSVVPWVGEPWLEVTTLMLGADLNVTAPAGGINEIAGFTVDRDDPKPVAIGYRLQTDGLVMELSSSEVLYRSLQGLNRRLVDDLSLRLLIMRLRRFLMAKCQASPFAADDLINGILTYLAQTASRQDECYESICEGIVQWVSTRDADSIVANLKCIEPGIAPRRISAMKSIAKHPNLARLSEVVSETRKRQQDYIVDMLIHSAKHAIVRSLSVEAGAENDSQIESLAWLSWDYPARGAAIYMYENSQKGSGLIRQVVHYMKVAPERVLASVERYMTHCPVNEKEQTIRHVLSLDEPALEILDDAFRRFARTDLASARREAWGELSSTLRKELGLALTKRVYSNLREVFTVPMDSVVGESTISNRALFWEVENWRQSFRRRTGRWPSARECASLMAREVASDRSESLQAWYAFQRELLDRREALFEAEKEACSRQIRHAQFSRILEAIETEEELNQWVDMDPESQVARIVDTLGLRQPDAQSRARRIRDALFSTMGDVVRIELYWRLQREADGLDAAFEERVRSQLVFTYLQQAIERRVLDSCEDGCPECIGGKCDTDDRQSAALTLSRQLLIHYIEYAKQGSIINVGESDNSESIVGQVREFALTGRRRIFLRSTLNDQAIALKAIVALKASGVLGPGGEQLRLEIAETTMLPFALDRRYQLYEMEVVLRGEFDAHP